MESIIFFRGIIMSKILFFIGLLIMMNLLLFKYGCFDIECVYVRIKAEYHQQFEEKEFTVKDFELDNIKEIKYLFWNEEYGGGWMMISYQKCQRQNFITLDFVEDVIYNFTDGDVVIVLTKTATRQFLTYTPEDFSEIDCISVDDITGLTVDHVRKYFAGEVKPEDEKLINYEKYRRILHLELKEKSKISVLNAIMILEQREDISSVGPNFIWKLPEMN